MVGSLAVRWARLGHAILWSALACTAGPTAFERATSLAREHRESEAAKLLQSHLASHPEDVPSRRLLVRVLALTGDLAAARREVGMLEQILGGSDPIPWIELGHAYEMTHDYDKALELYDHAAQVATNDPRGPREGGLRAARWGEADWARPRLEEAVRRGADDAQVWHALGLLRALAGELGPAEEAYRAGLRADPAALECHLGLATVAVMRADPSGALAEYDILVARRPSWAPAHLGRAWALALLGKKEAARAAIAEAERLGGDPAVITQQRQQLEEAPSGGLRRDAVPTSPRSIEPKDR